MRVTISEWVRHYLWALLAAVAFYESVLAWRYVTGDPNNFTAMFRAKYIANLPLVVSHGTASILALACGPLQFLPALRRTFPAVHRLTGKLYIAGVTIGGVTALWLAAIAEGGTLGRAGFEVMALLWLFTAERAWSAVRQRRYPEHQAWMLRNFALTFGAVMLRVYIHGAEKLGMDVALVYPWTAWAGWLPNVLLVELYIRRRGIRTWMRQASRSATEAQ